MVDYKVVKYCRLCKKRMVLEKSEKREIYCKPCKKKAQAMKKDD